MVPDRDATVSRTPEAARAPAPRSAGANPVLQGRRSQVGVPQGHVVDPPTLRPFSPEVPHRAQSVSDAAIGDLASPESTGAIRSIRSILSGGPSTMRATDNRMATGLSLLSLPIAKNNAQVARVLDSVSLHREENHAVRNLSKRAAVLITSREGHRYGFGNCRKSGLRAATKADLRSVAHRCGMQPFQLERGSSERARKGISLRCS